MRMRKYLAALLALCLLLALVPAATMEVVEIESAGEAAPEVETEDFVEEMPEEDEAPDAQIVDDLDLGGLSAYEIEDPVLEGDAVTNADTSLVEITRPANGGTVNTGTIDVWCRFVNEDPTGGFSRDDVWKYLGVNYELLKSGARIDLGVLTSYSGLVFVDDGIKVGSISITSPGDYTLRASVPGSPDVWYSVSFKVIGATITPEPTPEPTPVPTPEPVITTDSNGFGVDQRNILREYTGSAKDIVIPKNATVIGEDAFKGSDITGVTLHSGVTKILDFAFGETESLATVSFAEGLKSIGEGAFFQSGLKKLVLPGTVTTIGSGAFHQCASLTSVTVPASVSSMDGYMFSLSESLKTVTFEKGSKLKTFKTDMFYGDTALENVTLPDSLETLGEFAFTNCTSLKSLTLPDSLTTILNYAFENCTGLTELVIPAGVKIIEADVFKGCTNLTLVVTKGSYAEQYAKDVGIAYRSVSAATPKPTATPKPGTTVKPTATPKPGTTVKPTATPKPGTTAAPATSTKVNLSDCEFAVKDQVYSGKARTPAVTVKYGTRTLKKGTDYAVAYKNNKAIGTATATVTGKGKYTGTKKVTFSILPKGTAQSKPKAAKKAFTAKWKKQKNITGYEVQYGLKADFSDAKTKVIKKAKTTSVKIKKLKAKKKYYIRVRTYKTVKKVKYYSAWSKTKTVKTK